MIQYLQWTVVIIFVCKAACRLTGTIVSPKRNLSTYNIMLTPGGLSINISNGHKVLYQWVLPSAAMSAKLRERHMHGWRAYSLFAAFWSHAKMFCARYGFYQYLTMMLAVLFIYLSRFIVLSKHPVAHLVCLVFCAWDIGRILSLFYFRAPRSLHCCRT